MTWLTWVSARPDGELFAVGDSNGRIRVWCPAEDRVVARQELGQRVRRVEWTRDGAYLVAIGESDLLHVLAPDGSSVVATIATGHGDVHGLSVHPTKPLACTTGDDGHVRIWDLSTHEKLRDVEEPSKGTVTAMSEKHFAAGYRSGWFVAWDLEGDDKSVAGGEAFNSYVAAMAFSTNGAFLVSAGGSGGTLSVKTEAWVADEVWKSHPPKPIATNSIVFDGNRFLCAHSDDTASLFRSVGDRAPQGLGFPFHLDRKPWEEAYIVSCACFVPGAPMMLTAHFTGRLRVWKEDGILRNKIADVAFDDDDNPMFLGGDIAEPAKWWAELTGKPAREVPKRAAPTGAVVDKICAVCGASVKVPKPPAPEILPPLKDSFCSFDGRPYYEVNHPDDYIGKDGVALDVSILARALALETCSSCKHVAPALEAKYPQLDVVKNAAVREELLSLPDHHELARQFLYVAFLYNGEGGDLREEAWWALRAAWADEGAGLDARGQCLRKRAARLFAEAIEKNEWPQPDKAYSHVQVADIFRRAGDFASAARHLKIALVPGVSNSRTRRRVNCEGLFVVDSRTDTLTFVHASLELDMTANHTRESEIWTKLSSLADATEPAKPPKPVEPQAPKPLTDKPDVMLVGAPDRRVRSQTEAKLYAALQGCRKCSAPLVSLFPDRKEDRFILRGGCPKCETLNIFEFFAEPTAHVTTVKGREIGDATPTRIFTAAELLAHLHRLRGEVKPQLPQIAPNTWDENTAKRDRAITCANELLKMIPAGAATLPDDASTTRAWLEEERQRLLRIPPPDDDGAGLPANAQPNHLGALLDKSAKAPPSVGEIEVALGVRLDPAHLGGYAMGNVSGSMTSPLVPFWTAQYVWDIHHENPVASLADVRARRVMEWKATFLTGIDELEADLTKRFGAPRAHDQDRIYGETWIVASKGAAGGCDLSFHARLPDWAKPKADPAAREAALREIFGAAAAAPTHDRLVALRPNLLPSAGIVNHTPAQRASRLDFEFVPPMEATEFARILGLPNAAWQSGDVHQSDWHLVVIVGQNPYGPTTEPPRVGAWKASVGCVGRPKGPALPNGGPPGGTRPVVAGDVVGGLCIGVS